MKINKFSESLWLFGKSIGYVKGMFKISLGSSIHQMGVGLMTENGIKFSTSLILDTTKTLKSIETGSMFIKAKSGELPENFKELMKLK